MKRPTITFAREWDEFFGPDKRINYGGGGSHRATTSSRTGGKVNRGTVHARSSSGLDWSKLPPLCVHGNKARRCDDCGAIVCTCRGSLPHVCPSVSP